MSVSLSEPAPVTPAAASHASAERLPMVLRGGHRVSRPVLLLTALAVALAYASLWSPWWYPLSDSSLYLIMARNLANGQGLASLSQVHSSVRPLTPIMLSWIIRAGGSVGVMLAVMTGLMLVAHGLCFVTLRRWFDERVAYVATLVTAVSWWVFSNATTVMTEPLFLVMWWGGMAALTKVATTRSASAQWAWVTLCILGLVGAWFNRAAGLLLVPGVAVTMLLGLRHAAPIGRRVAWIAALAVIFGALFYSYSHKARVKGTNMEQASMTQDPGEAKPTRAERYKWNVLVGIDNPLIQLPVTGGRWMLESISAAFAVPAKSKSMAVRGPAMVIFITAFVLMTVGAVRLAWRGRWWIAIAAIYFLPFWVMWGTRVKPRYMTPVLPLMLIALWEGVAWVAFRTLPQKGDEPAARARASRLAAGLLIAAGVLLNAFPYAIELYVRHAPGRNFYDLARRGAYAELVDIADYLRIHAGDDDGIWENVGANRRIVNYLSTHAPDTIAPDLQIDSPDDPKLNDFFKHVRRKGARFALVFYKGKDWPIFHWPIPKPDESKQHPRWWQLFERDAEGRYHPVDVPVSREYVRDIVGLSKH